MSAVSHYEQGEQLTALQQMELRAIEAERERDNERFERRAQWWIGLLLSFGVGTWLGIANVSADHWRGVAQEAVQGWQDAVTIAGDIAHDRDEWKKAALNLSCP